MGLKMKHNLTVTTRGLKITALFPSHRPAFPQGLKPEPLPSAASGGDRGTGAQLPPPIPDQGGGCLPADQPVLPAPLWRPPYRELTPQPTPGHQGTLTASVAAQRI